MAGKLGGDDSVVLQRKITLLGGVAIIVGSIIGSGIFVSPGGVLQYAQSPGLALILWGICGILCIIGALCFSELGTMLPEAGGEYTYILTAFGPVTAFLTLWMNVVVIRPGAQAVLALVFAEYALALFYPGCTPDKTPVILLAALGLCLLTCINCVSVKLTMRIQTLFTGAKLLALGVIIAVGAYVLVTEGTSSFDAPFEGNPSVGNIALALYSGLFAFGGWNYLNFVTEELKDPYRNLPRAIWIAIPLVAVIYVLANLAYLAVLSPYEIMTSSAVAVMFGRRVLGPLRYAVPVFVALSTFGSLNGILFTSGRLFLAGARQGHLPVVLSFIGVKTKTPMPALLVTCTISLFMLPGDIIYLINCLSFVLWLTIGLAILALLRLRRTQPHLPRPIKVHIALPIIFLLCCGFLVILPIMTEPTSTGLGFAMTLTGLPVYFVGVNWKNKPKVLHQVHDKVTIEIQKLLNVVAPDTASMPLLTALDDDEE